MYGKKLFVDKFNNLYKLDHDGTIYFCSNIGKVRSLPQLQYSGKTEADYPVKQSYEELHVETLWERDTEEASESADTKKKELWLRVGVSIHIDEGKIDDADAITQAILSGVVSGNAYAPLEANENEWLNEELNYDLDAPIVETVIGNASTEMLIAELNKRGFKVINNNKAGSGETYLVTIDHVEGPCTQLCDTEANAKAFVFGHILSYDTFEEFDAALKGSIDAVDGIIDYSIVKQKLNEVKVPEGDDEDVDKEYEVTVYFFDMDTDPTTAYGEENYTITAPNEAEAKTEAIQKAYAESDHADENINFSTDAVVN